MSGFLRFLRRADGKNAGMREGSAPSLSRPNFTNPIEEPKANSMSLSLRRWAGPMITSWDWTGSASVFHYFHLGSGSVEAPMYSNSSTTLHVCVGFPAEAVLERNI